MAGGAGWASSSLESPSPGNQHRCTPANRIQYIQGTQENSCTASDYSWPQENFYQQPGYVSNKRALSPQIGSNSPNKRQQPYNPPVVRHPGLQFPEGMRPLFSPEAHQGGSHRDIGLGLYSHEEQGSNNRPVNAEYNSSLRLPPQYDGYSPYATQSTPPQNQSPAHQFHLSTPHDMKRSTRNQRFDAQQSYDQRSFRRAQTVAPESNLYPQNDQIPHSTNNFHRKQPRLQPAIWSGTGVYIDESRGSEWSGMPRVQEDVFVQASSHVEADQRRYFRVPDRPRNRTVHSPTSRGQHSRSQSIHLQTPVDYANKALQARNSHPRTPIEYLGDRIRSQSVYPETPNTNHCQGRSRPPHPTKFKVIKPDYGGLELENSASSENATPLQQGFRKVPHGSQQRQPDAEVHSLKASHVLPIKAMTYIKRSDQSSMGIDPSKHSVTKQSWREINIQFQNGGPDSPICLDSSREASVDRPTPKRSMPIKERLPRHKDGSKTKASKNLRPVPSPTENINVELDPEEVRRKVCADRIIAAEVKASTQELDVQMFGSIIQPNYQERELQAAAKRAEAQRNHEELMEEQTLKEEAAHLAEIKKKQDQEEALKMHRLRKEQEEETKKAKRDAERKRQAAIDAEVVEGKRKKAEERIKADRAKKAAESEQQEKEKEKARATELDQVKLELMKRDLEIKKLQAESLVRAKSSTTKPLAPSKTAEDPSRIQEDEDSLFIPEHGPVSRLAEQDIYNIDERAQLKAKSSDTIVRANPFAGAILKSEPGVHEDMQTLRAQRRLEEDKRRSENAKARLVARYNAKSIPPESHPPQKRPQPAREKQNTQTKHHAAKPKSNSKKPETTLGAEVEAKLEARLEAGLESALNTKFENTPNTLSRPPIIAIPTESEAINKRNSTPTKKSPLETLPLPALPQQKRFLSEVSILTDIERQKLENKDKALKDAQKQKRNEERRKRESDKVRNNKRQKLLDEAQKGGYTLSETEVNARVEQHMKEREEKYRKLMAKKALNQREESSTPTLPISAAHSLTQSRPQTQSQLPLKPPKSSFPSSSSSSMAAGSVEGETHAEDFDTPETRDRKRRTADLKEHISALNRTRGFRFAQTAAMCTVEDFQPDSDESEEDPDGEPTLESLFAVKKDQQPAQDDGSDESSEDDRLNSDGIPNLSLEIRHSAVAGTLNANDYDPQIKAPVADMRSHIQGLSQGFDKGFQTQGSRPPSSSQFTKKSFQKPNQEDDLLVRIYTVQQTITNNAVEGQATSVKMFTNREDANSCAEEMIRDLRSQHRKPQSISEEYEKHLFCGTVVFDRDNFITISVASKIDSSSILANFDPSKIESMYAEKVWQIKREMKSALQDANTLEITHTTIKEDADDKLYTDRELANYHASLNFIAFLKPDTPKIDDIIQHESKWAPRIREKREEADEAGDCFNFEINADDGELDWMDWGLVRYWVVDKEVTGPKN